MTDARRDMDRGYVAMSGTRLYDGASIISAGTPKN
jgi:hypothetical protein